MSYPDGLYVGLMSGTSVDGIDASLVEFKANQFQAIALHSQTYPSALQAQIKKLMQSGLAPLDELGSIDIAIGVAFASATNTLLAKEGFAADQIIAIGSHGQTVRHLPPCGNTPIGFSLQLGDASTIAAGTGIDVIAHFRQADMAHGGHGAPLAPAFHRFAFSADQTGVDNQAFGVLNLGGIANISVLSGSNTFAWDTGPASTLMDGWILRNLQRHFDDQGAWGASGTPNKALLDALMSHPYFSLQPPKSTGFETFSASWLDETLTTLGGSINPADVQATLLELTAVSVQQSLTRHSLQRLIVCGGGVGNTALMARLQELLPNTDVQASSAYGIDPQAVEAIAFAWLAWRHKQREAGNISAVTGATQEVTLGGFYPATKAVLR